MADDKPEMTRKEDDPEQIRQQMADTRASLTEKLETLETQVVDTVQGATTAVTETVASVKESVQQAVDTVKGSVQDTVDTVKETFDLRRQTERHPWAMLGGAVAVGCIGGYLLGGRGRRELEMPRSRAGESAWPAHGLEHSARAAAPPAQAESKESWVGSLGDTFGDEISKVKGMAVGALMGLLRDMIRRSVPENMGPQLSGVMDDVTRKMGGQPVAGPVLKECHSEPYSTQGETHERGYETEMARPLGAAQGQGQAALGQAHRR